MRNSVQHAVKCSTRSRTVLSLVAALASATALRAQQAESHFPPAPAASRRTTAR